VIYKSKDGRTSKTFEALDWLAQLVTHIPNKGEQMVRYYGLCKALHKPYYAEFKIMLSLIDRAVVQQIKSII
jgi:flavoprotein